MAKFIVDQMILTIWIQEYLANESNKVNKSVVLLMACLAISSTFYTAQIKDLIKYLILII